MNLLKDIQSLSLEEQINGCGESVIPFSHKISKHDTSYYKCEAKINGAIKTMATIFIDCQKHKIYIPDYFDVWVKDYLDSDKNIMVLNVALCNVYKKYGHNNCLIIDKKLKTVERFEPHGKPMKYYDDTPIENTIKQFVNEYFVEFYYLSPYIFIGNEGPQKKSNIILNLGEGRGLCANYTILYIYLRCKELLNPYESIDIMNTYFINDNILKFTHYVNNILSQ